MFGITYHNEGLHILAYISCSDSRNHPHWMQRGELACTIIRYQGSAVKYHNFSQFEYCYTPRQFTVHWFLWCSSSSSSLYNPIIMPGHLYSLSLSLWPAHFHNACPVWACSVPAIHMHGVKNWHGYWQKRVTKPLEVWDSALVVALTCREPLSAVVSSSLLVPQVLQSLDARAATDSSLLHWPRRHTTR